MATAVLPPLATTTTIDNSPQNFYKRLDTFKQSFLEFCNDVVTVQSINHAEQDRLKKWENDLTQREREAKTILEQAAKEKAFVSGVNQNEPITLNVGGATITTTRKALCTCQDSMLAAMFSGRHELQKTKEGHIFLDRDPSVFGAFLSILRNRVPWHRNHKEETMFTHLLDMEDIVKDEFDFFCVPLPRFEQTHLPTIAPYGNFVQITGRFDLNRVIPTSNPTIPKPPLYITCFTEEKQGLLICTTNAAHPVIPSSGWIINSREVQAYADIALPTMEVAFMIKREKIILVSRQGLFAKDFSLGAPIISIVSLSLKYNHNLPIMAAMDWFSGAIYTNTRPNMIDVYRPGTTKTTHLSNYVINEALAFGPVYHCTAMAVDSFMKRLILMTNNTLRLYDLYDSKFLKSIGSKGSGDGKFHDAQGLSVDGRGNIIVADTENKRIQFLNKDGDYLRQLQLCDRPKYAMLLKNNFLAVSYVGNSIIDIFHQWK